MLVAASDGASGRHCRGRAQRGALSGVDPLQIMFFRNFFCVVLMLPLLYRRGWSLVQTSQAGGSAAFALRCGFVAMLSLFRGTGASAHGGGLTAIGFLQRRCSARCSPSSSWASTVGCGSLDGTARRLHWRHDHAAPGGHGSSASGRSQRSSGRVAMGLIGPLVKQLAGRPTTQTASCSSPISSRCRCRSSRRCSTRAWPPIRLVWPQLVLLGVFAVLGHMTLVRGYAIQRRLAGHDLQLQSAAVLGACRLPCLRRVDRRMGRSG